MSGHPRPPWELYSNVFAPMKINFIKLTNSYSLHPAPVSQVNYFQSHYIAMKLPTAIEKDEDPSEVRSVYSCMFENPEGLARDEEEEVRKLALADTRRVQTMRLVIVALLAAAFGVTFVTYQLLAREQTKSFEAAFSQFSRSLADSARAHRREITHAFKALSEAVTAGELTSSSLTKWPYFHLPHFEHYARSFLDQAGGIEVVVVANRVEQEQTNSWVSYVNQTYEEWVKDTHIYQHGNLSYLDPVGYKPYITAVEPGKGFVPDSERPEYWVQWPMFPAPNSYILMNWNFASVPDYANAVEALKVLKTETLPLRVRSYASLIGTAFTKEYHDSLHAPVPEGETEYPHTPHFHAVLDRLDDVENAEVVGFVGGGVAWVS